ncbi:response regulator transcription factor [bacterium]|nr:response regulator transcription factor [bacterium]
MKVLIIDDDPNVHRLVSLFLKKLEIETIITASNGMAGLELFDSEKPDLVLLDLVMPGIHGDEILKKIKDRDPDSRVVILSSINTMEKVMTCLEHGALNYILKDSSPEDLFENLKEVKSNLISQENESVKSPEHEVSDVFEKK